MKNDSRFLLYSVAVLLLGVPLSGLIIYETNKELIDSGSLGGSLSVSKVSLEAEMEKTKSPEGEYVQILKGGAVDGAKTFDTEKVPPNTWTNVYDGPEGKGYQVVTDYDDRTEYVGYGAEAGAYTYTVPHGSYIASTTKP